MESPLICLKAFSYKDNTLPIDQDTDGTEVISIKKKKKDFFKKCLRNAEGAINLSLSVYVLFNFLLIVQ